MTNKPTFKTDNLTLATSLYSIGYPITLQMVSTTKAVFSIPFSDKLNVDISKFWSNELSIPPLTFQAKNRELRQKIDSLIRSQEVNNGY